MTMATGTTTTISAKRAPRARKQQASRTRVASKSAPKTAPQVEATVSVRTKPSRRSAQIDPRTLAFAYVGAGDLAIAKAREVSGKVIDIVRNPREVQDLTGKVSLDVTKVVGDLAARGEKLVGRIRGSAYTKRAMSQSKVARSQIKAATTSVRKAVDSATVAAREAVKKVS